MIGSLLAVLVSLCIEATDGRAGQTVRWPVQAFTLAWEHTIEKQRWEEDYELRPTPTRQQGTDLALWPVAARVKGSGPGMEPGSDAILRDGWYHYRPQNKPYDSLLLARSSFAKDYELCKTSGPAADTRPGDGSKCRTLSSWPELATAERVRLYACPTNERSMQGR